MYQLRNKSINYMEVKFQPVTRELRARHFELIGNHERAIKREKNASGFMLLGVILLAVLAYQFIIEVYELKIKKMTKNN